MISVILNLDSRPGVESGISSFTGHNNGVRAFDLFEHGVRNKIKFFEGFEIEVIVFIDEHVRIPNEILDTLRGMVDCVTIRKHSESYRGADFVPFFNDINYIHALSQARGEIICHVDQDTAVFARGKSSVEELLSYIDTSRFCSYPSPWHPRAVDDPSFGKHNWVSTRFFLCNRKWIEFDVLEHALRDPEWAYQKYGRPQRICPWTEHFLSISNEESVIYPPRKDDQYLIFCWDHYVSGVLEKLNLRSYEEVLAYVTMCQGIHYPCDVTALNP
jgi:hypothetical protein